MGKSKKAGGKALRGATTVGHTGMSMRLRLLALTLAATLLLSGCWSRKELNTLGFVSAVALDKEGDDQVRVTIEMVKPMALGGEQGRTSEKAYYTMESTGQTTFDAVRNVLKRSTKRPFWQHNRFILICEELAREGIWKHLDVFMRDGETRLNAFVLISRGVAAGQLVQVEFDADAIPSEGGFGLITTSQEGLSKQVMTDLNHMMQKLESDGIEMAAPAVTLFDKGSGEPTQVGNVTREGARLGPEIVSTAVFKGDKLVGWLDDVEGRGLLWVLGKTRSGIITVDAPGVAGAKIGLEMLKSTTDLEVTFIDGQVVASVDIEVDASLGDSQVELNPSESQDQWYELERRLEEAVKGEVSAAVAKAKELGSDVLGFGAALKRQDSRAWLLIKDSWDQYFKDSILQVNVKGKLRHTGRSLRTIKF
jgi:spore germination protein KC